MPEKKEEFNVWPMYSVKIKTQSGDTQRKSSDNEGLLRWMEMKEITASIYNIDLDRIKDKPVSYLKAKVMEESWMQLKLFLQDSLGLLEREPEPEPEEEEAEPELEEEDDTVTEIIEPRHNAAVDNNRKPVLQPVKKAKPQQQPDEDFFESSDDEATSDDEIVL